LGSTKPKAHLFTLRLWFEQGDTGAVEWRGRAEHLATGQTCHFRDWQMLILRLQEMLAEAESRSLNAGQ
jgi:hypothetical protein